MSLASNVTALAERVAEEFVAVRSEMGSSGGLPPGWYNVMDFGAEGDGTTDDAAAFQDAIDTVPEGSAIWVPPVADCYLIGTPLVVDRHVNLMGSWARDKNDDTSDQIYGSLLQPTNSTAQGTMDAGMIRVQNSWVLVEGLALQGHGQAFGGAGLRFSGTDPNSEGKHCHAAIAQRVASVEFELGFVFGDWSDHCTLRDCAANGNLHGVSFEEDNHYDHQAINCWLDGNLTSSVFLPDEVGTDNFSLIRCHLGFSQYGILQDDTSESGNGFSGLKVISTPIEGVTLGMISLGTGGNISVEGGYWGWLDDPASPCVFIRAVEFGPCTFSPVLHASLKNDFATAFIEIGDYNNFPIEVPTASAVGDFTGGAPVFGGEYIGASGAPYSATFEPESDYATEQYIELTGAMEILTPVGRTDRPVKLQIEAVGDDWPVSFDDELLIAVEAGPGPHVVMPGETLFVTMEYAIGPEAWVVTDFRTSDALVTSSAHSHTHPNVPQAWQSLSSGSTLTMDCDNGTRFRCSALTENTTVADPTDKADGQQLLLAVVASGGTRTVNLNGSIVNLTGDTFPVSVGSGKRWVGGFLIEGSTALLIASKVQP